MPSSTKVSDYNECAFLAQSSRNVTSSKIRRPLGLELKDSKIYKKLVSNNKSFGDSELKRDASINRFISMSTTSLESMFLKEPRSRLKQIYTT